jgi:hypothetical protein
MQIELKGMERLHIGSRPPAEIRRNYHNYLLEDMSELFWEYRLKVSDADYDEIRSRVEYLEHNYHKILGRVFGIMFNTKNDRLDMLLYPINGS